MFPRNYDPAKFVCNPGSRFEPEYIGEPDENGMIKLVEVGQKDLVAMHQRDADLNNVNILYERFCNGDITALSRMQGSYLDTIGMPHDLRGVYETAENFRRVYDNLPADKKKEYSFERFMSEAGSESWIKAFTTSAADSAPPSPAAEPSKT